MSAGTTTGRTWINTVGGVTYVKAVIVSNSTDPEMTDLRAAVLANGGSVFMRFYAVPALSVMLPTTKVAVLAARADVTSISPDRATARTAIRGSCGLRACCMSRYHQRLIIF